MNNRGNEQEAPPSQPSAGDEGATATAPLEEGDLLTMTRRVSRMQKQLLQDTSAIRHDVDALTNAVPEGLDRITTTVSMVARSVATAQVKAEEQQLETRRFLTAQMDALAARIEAEMRDRALERVFLTGTVDALDAVDAVLRHATPAEREQPIGGALRMVRDKLLGAFQVQGLLPIAVIVGDTAFDDALHECVGTDTETDAPDGAVTDVHARGYTLRGRLVRRAGVIVKRR